MNVQRTAASRDPFEHAERIVERVCGERHETVCFWNVDPKIKLLVTKALAGPSARQEPAASMACAPSAVVLASPRASSREVQAKALNDRGDVVGFADSNGGKGAIHAILWKGGIAGNVLSWPGTRERLVGYWIGRDYWGRGVATAALAAFLAELSERPLHARVATANLGSIRVLEKCGFERVGETADETGLVEARYRLG